MSCSFTEIPAGTYAIAVFQDENSNGECDKNFYGALSEPYGFSKNKRGMFGPPDFSEVKFTVYKGKKSTINITID